MDSALGKILVQSRLVDEDRLSRALRFQQGFANQAASPRLGEILVRSGEVNQRELQMALERQSKLREIEFFSVQLHPSVESRYKRILDILGACIGCLIFLMLLPVLALLIKLDSSGPIFSREYRVGLRGMQFSMFRFRTSTLPARGSGDQLPHVSAMEPRLTRIGKFLKQTHLDDWPQFLNVLQGYMSLVGPRPPSLGVVRRYSRDDWQRLSVKPGMTGVWQTRKKHAVDFEQLKLLDMIYVRRWRPTLDLKLLVATVRHLIVRLAGRKGSVPQALTISSNSSVSKVSLLNIDIDNIAQSQFLRQLKQGVVFTPNVDHLVQLQSDLDFYKAYQQADYRVCDSQILIYASRFLNRPIREKISGSDFFPAFCDFHRSNEGITIFLLGGAEGIAEQAQSKINQRLGRKIIVKAHSPSFGFEHNRQECQDIIALINSYRPTVLAVGVGAPKQEKWISHYKKQLPSVKIFLAIGATIDFEAEHKGRSPQWLSNAGLEWLYRLLSEPRRLWKRYLIDDLPFFGFLLKQKLGLYSSPWSGQETGGNPSMQTLERYSSK